MRSRRCADFDPNVTVDDRPRYRFSFFMPDTLHRVGRGALFLTVVVIVSVLGFRFLGGYDWIESLWMVVITISTVGFSEKSELPPHMQLFVIAVIVLGMSGAAHTIGGLIQLMLEGEIERVLGKRRMTNEIRQLRDHVIICGFGRIGQQLASELTAHGNPLVVVETDSEMQQVATEQGYFCVVGNATEENVLTDVGIDHAATLVTALGSDAENVFITLTARNMNPDIQIISRAESESTERKLLQAGANQVVMPTIVGARMMSRMITHPTTADLIDLLSQSGFEDLEMEEIVLDETGKIVGSTIAETEAHRKHKLLIVAVKRAGGELVFNPIASHVFLEGDTAIVMGHAKDIDRFRAEFV